MFFIRSFEAMYQFVNEAIATLTVYIDGQVLALTTYVNEQIALLTAYVDEQVGSVKFTSRCSVRLADSYSMTQRVDRRIPFNTELWDNDSEFASYRFTAKKAGIYHVSAQLWYLITGTTIQGECWIAKNGALVFHNKIPANGAGAVIVGVSGDIQFAIGDYLEVWGRHWSFSTAYVSKTTSQTYLTIHQIA